MEKKTWGISQETLKLIACITMLIDHVGATLVLLWQSPHMPTVYYAFRMIGRIAFPIYAFLLAEGMRHTRNPWKYILRLAIGIALAEIPFDLAFEGHLTWEYQSVMFTLTLGAVMLWCMTKTDKKILKVLLILPFVLAAEWLNTDYGGWGIAMIAAFGLFDRLPVQILCIGLINWLIPSLEIPILGMNVSIQLFGVLAMIPIGLYSGCKLTHSSTIQWAFYLFYPVHMLILWLILLILR